MKFFEEKPPRVFKVGMNPEKQFELKDCGKIYLNTDEQVTFVTPSKAEYDVTRKNWGFYATPSINGRLKNFGLRGVLVKNQLGRYFLLLVEKGKEKELKKYLKQESNKPLLWFDNDEDLQKLSSLFEDKKEKDHPTCFCTHHDFSLVHAYASPPPGEVTLKISRPYLREIYKCKNCDHFISKQNLIPENFYEGVYVDSTYGKGGIETTFNKIINLPLGKSDNKARVQRIQKFYESKNTFKHSQKPLKALDIGSGLCVFLHELKKLSWDCTALDPDERATQHAEHTVKIKSLCGDFMNMDQDLGSFDLITFNKVLEHVKNPVAMLEKSHRYVNPQGYVYVELPDGEEARKDGFHREEFFIDHHHIFSAQSLLGLAHKAGFVIQEMGRLEEPSSKYTLWGFLRKL